MAIEALNLDSIKREIFCEHLARELFWFLRDREQEKDPDAPFRSWQNVDPAMKHRYILAIEAALVTMKGYDAEAAAKHEPAKCLYCNRPMLFLDNAPYCSFFCVEDARRS